MNSSAGGQGIGIPFAPDWLTFLQHSNSCTEKERRAWCRDAVSRDRGLACIIGEIAASGWCGPGAFHAEKEEEIPDLLDSGTILSLAAQLSLVRWYEKNPLGEQGAEASDRILTQTILALSLAVGLSEELKGGGSPRVYLHAMLSGVGDWLLCRRSLEKSSDFLQLGKKGSGDEPEKSWKQESDALREEALRRWGMGARMDESEQDLVRCALAGAEYIVGNRNFEELPLIEAMTLALPGYGNPSCALHEVVHNLDELVRETWMWGDHPQCWPGRIAPLLKKLSQRSFNRDGKGYSLRALRRLTVLTDHPFDLDRYVDFLFRFSRGFLKGMILAFGWRDGQWEPGSSWFRREGGEGMPLPDALERIAGEKGFTTLSAKDLPGDFHPSGDRVWVFSFAGLSGCRGWVLSKPEADHFPHSCRRDLLFAAVSRMGAALRIHHWQKKLRAESSKNALLRKELLLEERKLEDLEEVTRQLQRTVTFRDVLPGIFHKLKNKLTPIMGYTQMLKSRTPDSYTAQRLGKIEKSSDDLAGLLNRMRTYFSASPLMMRPDCLNRVILRIRPQLEEVAGKSQVEIRFDLDERLSDFPMVPGQVEVLLNQVVKNACRAVEKKGKSGGAIRVRTRALEDGGSELSVRDSGIGLKEADFELIWAPFYSGFSDADGLGLALCERILLRHGAHWHVESRVGEFSEFVFAFPFRGQQEKSPPRPEPDSAIRGRVLILDDEDFMVELMGDILTEVGDLEVHATTSGARALRWIQEQEYELVIADLYLPDINGLDIFKAMNDQGMADRLILVTADPGSAEVREFLESRRIAYLRKPIELMLFKQKVIEKLTRKEA